MRNKKLQPITDSPMMPTIVAWIRQLVSWVRTLQRRVSDVRQSTNAHLTLLSGHADRMAFIDNKYNGNFKYISDAHDRIAQELNNHLGISDIRDKTAEVTRNRVDKLCQDLAVTQSRLWEIDGFVPVFRKGLEDMQATHNQEVQRIGMELEKQIQDNATRLRFIEDKMRMQETIAVHDAVQSINKEAGQPRKRRMIVGMQERRGYCSYDLIVFADDGTMWRYVDYKAGETPSHIGTPCAPHWEQMPVLPDA